MQQELLDANQKLRDAVEARLAGGCCDGGKCQPKAIDTRSPLPDVEEVIEEDDARLPPDWILQGQRELEAAPDDIRWKGDGIMATPPDGLRPGSREFVETLEEIKQLHLRKTLDYGVDDDALSNIRESAQVVNMPSWAGAILRISDKMHRLKAYFRRGKVEFDGIEDTLKDIASYAAIALVLYREQSGRPG